MAVVTISRQLGSSGGEVGRRVAELLDYDLVNRETLTEAARKYPILKSEEFARLDEIKPRFLESVFGGRRIDYYHLMSALIYGFAEKGKVVIVGGGAQVFLKDIPGALHVRVTCSMSRRVKNIAERHKVDADKARKLINDSDRNRAHFFKLLFEADWSNPAYYDMVLRTDKLDVETASRIIAEASKIKEIEASWEVSHNIINKLSLTSRIKAAFRTEKYEDLKHININVTSQGFVHLTGHVSSEEEKARAEEVVRSMEGVSEVINELTLIEFTPPMVPY